MPAPPPSPDKPPPSFDDAMEQVEQIIARIESGEIGLERSIAEYERGAALIRSCRQTLQRAEQRVRDLTAQMHADGGGGGGDAQAPAPSSVPPSDEPDPPF